MLAGLSVSDSGRIADCTYMKNIFDALQKTGFSEDALEKIAYKNVERVIREVM